MYEGGLSSHGIRYAMSDFPFQNDGNKTSAIYELVAEAIRVQFFPEHPSRLQSYFAVHPSDVDKWLKQFNLENTDYTLYEIETDKHFKADAKFLSSEIINMPQLGGGEIDGFPFQSMSIARLAYQLCFYWRGASTDDPLYEYLLPSFKVIKRVN
jgi:hypothetical protein